MENEKKIELNYKLLIVFAIAVPLILGTAYAYFLPKITGDEPSTVTGTVVEGIDFELITPDKNGYINANDLVPINDGKYYEPSEVDEKASKGSFSVKSNVTNGRNLKYSIGISIVEMDDALKTEDFRWRLEKVDASGNVIKTYNDNEKGFGSISSDNTITLTTGIVIAPSATDNYVIKLWISNTNFDQCPSSNESSCIINKNFKGKIFVDAEYTL